MTWAFAFKFIACNLTVFIPFRILAPFLFISLQTNRFAISEINFDAYQTCTLLP